LLNAAFAVAILDLIPQVHLPSFVNMLVCNVNSTKCLSYRTVWVSKYPVSRGPTDAVPCLTGLDAAKFDAENSNSNVNLD
jgi:hypothetical protein